MRRFSSYLLIYLGLTAILASYFLPKISRPLDQFTLARNLIDDMRGVEAVHLLEDRVWRGVAEYRSSRYRRAVDEFAQAQGVMPLYNLGTSYARLGEWAGAKAAFERTLSLDPSHEDAAFNLELVLKALALQQKEADAQRDTRVLGKKKGSDSGQNGEEKGSETTAEKTNPSADSAPSERTGTRAGQVPVVGRTGEKAQTQDAAAGRGAAADTTDDGSEHRAGAGAIRLRQTSEQNAEILLRAIQDDPEAVLRARLWSIDRQRRERGQ